MYYVYRLFNAHGRLSISALRNAILWSICAMNTLMRVIGDPCQAQAN